MRWLPFQLNPDLPETGMPRREYIERKWGPGRGPEVYSRVSAVGQSVGIPFAFENIVVQPNTLEAAKSWLVRNLQEPPALEAGARRFALTLGRGFALALLARHAQWCIENEHDRRPLAAARRFAAARVNLLHDMDAVDASMLARDESVVPTTQETRHG